LRRLTLAQLVEKLPAFCGIRNFVAKFTRARQCLRPPCIIFPNIQVEVVWVVTPCNIVVGYQCFGGLCCFHLKDEVTRMEKMAFYNKLLSIPKLKNLPVSAVCDCLFSIFVATVHVWKTSFPSSRHDVETGSYLTILNTVQGNPSLSIIMNARLFLMSCI